MLLIALYMTTSSLLLHYLVIRQTQFSLVKARSSPIVILCLLQRCEILVHVLRKYNKSNSLLNSLNGQLPISVTCLCRFYVSMLFDKICINLQFWDFVPWGEGILSYYLFLKTNTTIER